MKVVEKENVTEHSYERNRFKCLHQSSSNFSILIEENNKN